MNHEKKLIYVLQNIRTHHKQVIDKVNEEMTQAKALLSTLRDYCEELLKKDQMSTFVKRETVY